MVLNTLLAVYHHERWHGGHFWVVAMLLLAFILLVWLITRK